MVSLSPGFKGNKYGFVLNSTHIFRGLGLDLRDGIFWRIYSDGLHQDDMYFCWEDMLCAALPELNTADVVAIADTPKIHLRHTIAMSEGYDIWWLHLTSVCRSISSCWFISSGRGGQMDADGCSSVTGCRLRAVSVCLEWGIGRNELGIPGEMWPCGFGILSMFIVFPRCSSSLPLCKALPGGLVTLIRWQTAANNIPHYCWHGRRT